MDINTMTQTRTSGIAGSSSVCISARGHVLAGQSSVPEFGGLVVGDRAKGQLADVTNRSAIFVPAYTRGTPAWRPPLS